MEENNNNTATAPEPPAPVNPFQIVPSEIETSVKISIDTISVILIIVGVVIAATTIFIIRKSF